MKTKPSCKFLLIIDGPMCAGKTTTAKALMKMYSGVIRVSDCKIKWFISDYGKGLYRKEKDKLTVGFTELCLQNNFPVAVEGYSLMRDNFYKDYKSLAKKYDFKFLVIRVEATYEVMLQRLKKRACSGLNQEECVQSLSVEEPDLKKRFDAYQEHVKKSPKIPTIRSDQMEPDDRAKYIAELFEL